MVSGYDIFLHFAKCIQKSKLSKSIFDLNESMSVPMGGWHIISNASIQVNDARGVEDYLKPR